MKMLSSKGMLKIIELNNLKHIEEESSKKGDWHIIIYDGDKTYFDEIVKFEESEKKQTKIFEYNFSLLSKARAIKKAFYVLTKEQVLSVDITSELDGFTYEIPKE